MNLRKYKISDDTLEAMPITMNDNKDVVLEYALKGEIVYTEKLHKHKETVYSGIPLFFDIDCLEQSDRAIITDSYIDKLSYNEIGIDYAVSIPYNKDCNFSYIGSCIDYFEHIKIIYLSIKDNDTREELARRLGKIKCKIVNYDNRSANDVLVAGGDLNEYLEEATDYPIAGIHLVMDHKQTLLDYYDNGFPAGAMSGFNNFDELVSFYTGMLVVITGYPSHGKTTFLNSIIHGLYKNNGWKTGIYSPEYWNPELHYMIMSETVAQKPFMDRKNQQCAKMSREELNNAITSMSDWFYKVEPDGECTVDVILQKQKELVQRYGIKAFIIDPWITITHHAKTNELKSDSIGENLNKIKKHGKENGVCNILVAHPKSPDTKTGAQPPPPLVREISGSANFQNIADIGMSVYRKRNENAPDTMQIWVQKNRLEKICGDVGTAYMSFNEYEYRLKEINNFSNESNEVGF